MPVYPSCNLVFVHVPKTAGGAIQGLLAPYLSSGRRTPLNRILSHLPIRRNVDRAYFPKHATASHLRQRMGQAAWDSFTSFAIVRNPYDSAISHYEFVRQTPTHHRHKKANTQTLDAFVKSRRVAQARYLTDADNRIIVDHVIRFENLHDELNDLFASLNLPERIHPGGSTNTSKKAPRRTYLTPAAIASINRKMHLDFELFGYAKLDPAQGTSADGSSRTSEATHA